MAGRKDKLTVTYFPHYVNHGKSLFIIETKFGHEGYAVWFKTLELLGASENHFIDIRNECDFLFVCSKLNLNPERLKEIYNLFAKLGCIDQELYDKSVIFSQKLIENVADVYERRKSKSWTREQILIHLFGIVDDKNNLRTHNCAINANINNLCKHICDLCIHNYTKESKVKESEVNEIKPEIPPSPIPIIENETFMSIPQLWENLKNDGVWIDLVSMRVTKTEPTETLKQLKEFLYSLQAKGVEVKSINDTKAHFVNYLKKQKT